MAEVSVSVVIVTWNRPTYVNDCLEHLGRMVRLADQVVVVDASKDDETERITRSFPSISYIRFPRGAGHMTSARNEGLLHATGDVIAFLDDDALVRADWLSRLTDGFENEDVHAICGRTCNGHPDEGEPIGPVGRLLATGFLTAEFAAELPSRIPIDHGIGANMAFRRSLLAQLGGFRDDYPGTALREDTDIFLRIKQLGHQAYFDPSIVVDHVAAPHVKGRRFDKRYQFWGAHNHVLLLTRHCGLAASLPWRWSALALAGTWRTGAGGPGRRAAKCLFTLTAVAAGFTTSVRKAGVGPSAPERHDRQGRLIREALAEAHVMKRGDR